MIKITSLISILKHEKYRLLELWVYGSKKIGAEEHTNPCKKTDFNRFFCIKSMKAFACGERL